MPPRPGRSRPAWPSVELARPLALSMASRTAASTRSWSISTSAGSATDGSIVTSLKSSAPDTFTFTAPPPALPSTTWAAAASCASRRFCCTWPSCEKRDPMSNGSLTSNLPRLGRPPPRQRRSPTTARPPSGDLLGAGERLEEPAFRGDVGGGRLVELLPLGCCWRLPVGGFLRGRRSGRRRRRAVVQHELQGDGAAEVGGQRRLHLLAAGGRPAQQAPVGQGQDRRRPLTGEEAAGGHVHLHRRPQRGEDAVSPGDGQLLTGGQACGGGGGGLLRGGGPLGRPGRGGSGWRRGGRRRWRGGVRGRGGRGQLGRRRRGRRRRGGGGVRCRRRRDRRRERLGGRR